MAGSTEPTTSRRHQCSPAKVDAGKRLALTESKARVSRRGMLAYDRQHAEVAGGTEDRRELGLELSTHTL
jgi:hypothetical protein